MLSNTYVRIACANENNRIKKLLERLCGDAGKTALVNENGISLPALVEKIELERRTRRFEKYILPFIEADDSKAGILGKMHEIRKDISICAASLLPVLKEAFEHGTIDRSIFVPEVKRYCDLNKKLLDYEESEWSLPVKGTVSEDGWFALAESFIKEDKELFDDKYLNEKEVFDMIPDSSAWRGRDARFEYRV